MATTGTHNTAIDPAGDVALLEKLRLQGVKVKPKNAWKQRIGWAKDSVEHAEAARLGAEWRKETNRESIQDLDGCS